MYSFNLLSPDSLLHTALIIAVIQNVITSYQHCNLKNSICNLKNNLNKKDP